MFIAPRPHHPNNLLSMNTPFSGRTLQNILDLLSQEETLAFFETTRVVNENHRTFLFLRPEGRLTCKGDDDPALFFKQAEEYLNEGFYLAGWFSYEFGYLLEPALARQFKPDSGVPLAELGVFRTPHIFDHLTQTFSGAGPWPTANTQGNHSYHINHLRLSRQKDDYIQNIEQIKKYIEAGDTYQVNYTLKLMFDFQGSPEALYKALRRNQNVSFGAYIKSGDQQVVSLSPELFFKKQGDTCTVRPMKGTIQRGRTMEEDARFARFLQHDIKNRSENVMIVDLLRNDLGRICEMGSVSATSLFDVETYETLHQMTSTIQGKLLPDISLDTIFRALFPCGSVTGAPKIHTMEIIHELEHEFRGIYTGAIGFITPAKDAFFNVPIRTVVLNNGRGEMGIGSGVVYDSNPEQEWEECRLKGRFLTEPVPDFQLIETILWKPGEGYWLLDRHLKRLLQSAGYFGYHADKKNMIEELNKTAKNFPDTLHQRIRLTLAKDGTLEVTATECSPPRREILPEAAPPDTLPKVTFSERTTDSNSPYLYHKTTIRDIYDREREKAAAEGFFEVIFCNEKGEATEGGITNIFIRNGDKCFTPPVTSGLLAGIFREHFLENSPFPVEEKVLTRQEVETADAIYVGNSVRGLIQVTLGK